jgi:hypothetical protein
MGRRSIGRVTVGIVVAICLAVLAPAAPAAVKAVYVADEAGGGDPDGCGTGGMNPCGAIFKVPPDGGPGTVLARGSAGSPLQAPSGLIRFGDRFLLAADYHTHSVVKVNRKTGAVRTFVASPKFESPIDLAKDGDDLYVTDFDRDALFVVDLDTKRVRKVNARAITPNAAGLAIAGDTAYVSNWDQTVYKVNIPLGRVRTVLDDDPAIDGADGLALSLSPDRDFLYVAAPSAQPNALVRVGLPGGATRMLAHVEGIVAVTLRPGGGFLASDTDSSRIAAVSQNGSKVRGFSNNPKYNYPHDIVIWKG